MSKAEAAVVAERKRLADAIEALARVYCEGHRDPRLVSVDAVLDLLAVVKPSNQGWES